jgi:hypothetical protein
MYNTNVTPVRVHPFVNTTPATSPEPALLVASCLDPTLQPTWHNEAEDITFRRSILLHILIVLKAKYGGIDARISSIARRAELALYSRAHSREEYKNPQTLCKRLHALIIKLYAEQHWKRQAVSRCGTATADTTVSTQDDRDETSIAIKAVPLTEASTLHCRIHKKVKWTHTSLSSSPLCMLFQGGHDGLLHHMAAFLDTVSILHMSAVNRRAHVRMLSTIKSMTIHARAVPRLLAAIMRRSATSVTSATTLRHPQRCSSPTRHAEPKNLRHDVHDDNDDDHHHDRSVSCDASCVDDREYLDPHVRGWLEQFPALESFSLIGSNHFECRPERPYTSAHATSPHSMHASLANDNRPAAATLADHGSRHHPDMMPTTDTVEHPHAFMSPSNNAATSWAISALGHAHLPHLRSLSFLHVYCDGLSDPLTRRIADLIWGSRNASVQSHRRKCHLNSNLNLPSLTELRLCGNAIGDTGALSLAAHIDRAIVATSQDRNRPIAAQVRVHPHGSAIQKCLSLVLDDNFIGERGASALVAAAHHATVSCETATYPQTTTTTMMMMKLSLGNNLMPQALFQRLFLNHDSPSHDSHVPTVSSRQWRQPMLHPENEHRPPPV